MDVNETKVLLALAKIGIAHGRSLADELIAERRMENE